jgi:putative membrane protein
MSETPRRPKAFATRPDRADQPPVKPDAEAPLREPAAQRRPVSIPVERATVDANDPFDATDQPGLDAELEALTPPPAIARRRRISFARIAGGAFALLVSLALGLWADQLIRDLFARADWLGWTAFAILAVGVVALLVAVAREVLALMRLSAVQALKEEAAKARQERKTTRARAVIAGVTALFADRPETARGRAALADLEGEIVDSPQLIDFAERELLLPLDIQARALILNAAKRVSIVTAVSPRALVDIAYVLYESARLVRAMATLYGGRPGTFGLLRLVRDVIGHLAVTSSIAIGDSLVQQLVGHGVASRLSARLGEGVINGLMTARIGIAAMDLCRPLAFHAVRRPGIGDFLGDLTRIAQKQSDGK